MGAALLPESRKRCNFSGGAVASEVPRKRVLVADPDEVVAFIASHILSRYDFAVQTVTSAAALSPGGDGFEAMVVSDSIAAQVKHALDPSRVIVLGEGVEGLKPFARLRKPLEIGQLVAAVNACVNRR
jgi:CheY-like chemotaxis protein